MWTHSYPRCWRRGTAPSPLRWHSLTHTPTRLAPPHALTHTSTCTSPERTARHLGPVPTREATPSPSVDLRPCWPDLVLPVPHTLYTVCCSQRIRGPWWCIGYLPALRSNVTCCCCCCHGPASVCFNVQCRVCVSGTSQHMVPRSAHPRPCHTCVRFVPALADRGFLLQPKEVFANSAHRTLCSELYW